MNPLKVASRLGKIAAEIADTMKIDHAAILTIEGRSIAAFFGGTKEYSKEEMAEVLEKCGQYFLDTAKKVARGEIEAQKLDHETTYIVPPSTQDHESPPDELSAAM